MNFLKSVASMAQNAIESINNPKHLTADQLMQQEFRMPTSEHIINVVACDYIITSRVLYSLRDGAKSFSYLPPPIDANVRVSGVLTITDNYFMARKNGSDQDKVVFHLATIKSFHKIPNAEMVHVRISTNNGMILDVFTDAPRNKAEQFWYLFNKQHELCKSQEIKLMNFQMSLYSEYLISKNCKNSKLGEKHLDIPLHPKGGLGLMYKFPGDQTKEQEVMKLKRWFEYFRRYGRNLELVQNPFFFNLIYIGVPNRLRGEIWELSCGAIYLRYQNNDEYGNLLLKNKDGHSLAIEEIEKDLNRSLPEYSAFQTPDGINKLRKVLTAYSWKNPEIGYCQAMNIVSAALLIFMSEEQAYWTINVLCEKLIPGYYSKTMYGVLLDQKVFEALVKKSLPSVGDQFAAHDIQLSIVSLPWFLSLFINTMPLVFAFRVLDAFFIQGPRVLFQIALAIIKVNSEKLLQCTDDGECIAIFKEYFMSLDETFPVNGKLKRNFDLLWETALKEFSIIDDKLIERTRNVYKNEVFEGIDLFVKRAEIRNLPKMHYLTNDQLSNIYDRYYRVLLQDKDDPNRGELSMEYYSFKIFMSEITPWASLESQDKTQDRFLHRLYSKWSNESDLLSLQTLVSGLDRVRDRDLMNSLSYFFELYLADGEKDRIPKETVLELAEELIFITSPWRDGTLFDTIANRELEDSIAEKLVEKREALIAQGVQIDPDQEISLPDEVKFDEEKWKGKQSLRYLSASSSFLNLAFQYALPYEDTNAPLIELDDTGRNESITHNKALDPNTPVYITSSMFRMIVLANETYSSFFEHEFWASFDVDLPGNTDQSVLGDLVGNIRGVVNNVMADGVRVANQVKKRMGDARARADTSTSMESGLSSLGSAQVSATSKLNSHQRESIDSKGAASINTGWTLESGALNETFDDSNIDDFMENPEETVLLGEKENEYKEKLDTVDTDGDEDEYGNFIQASNKDTVNEVKDKISDLLL